MYGLVVWWWSASTYLLYIQAAFVFIIRAIIIMLAIATLQYNGVNWIDACIRFINF